MTEFETYARIAGKAGASFDGSELIAEDTTSGSVERLLLKEYRDMSGSRHTRVYSASVWGTKWIHRYPSENPIQWFDRRSLRLLPQTLEDL